MFIVTDLGSTYSLQQDSSGVVQTVTGESGQVYDFYKTPMTQVDQVTNHPDGGNLISTTIIYEHDSIQVGYSTYLLYQTGLTNQPFSNGVDKYGVNFETFGGNPISDANIKGMFIGTGIIANFGFPAFSYPNNSLGGANLYYNDLNAYIAQSLAINLTSAVKIDDNGDIIAYGTQNGINQYFLLNLVGPPTTAPEPSAFVTLGIGAAAVYWARRRRSMKS
jgi:hypothetical protein